MSYLDAVELAYSGAQIIHPKTIKPLENKQTPLYVNPFGTPELPGSVIKGNVQKPIDVPVLILRKKPGFGYRSSPRFFFRVGGKPFKSFCSHK